VAKDAGRTKPRKATVVRVNPFTGEIERVPTKGRTYLPHAISSKHTTNRPKIGASKATRPRPRMRPGKYAALRFTYRRRSGLRVGEVQLRLDQIIDLLVVAGDDLVSEPRDEASIEEQIERARQRVRTQTRVVRLHYNPVLELTIAAGVAAASAIIALYKRYSDARVEAAKADIAGAKARAAIAESDTAIAKERFNQEVIASMLDELQQRRLHNALDPLPDPALAELINNAAGALILPQKVEAVDKNQEAIEM
jgi:hypothetical protein